MALERYWGKKPSASREPLPHTGPSPLPTTSLAQTISLSQFLYLRYIGEHARIPPDADELEIAASFPAVAPFHEAYI